jgi:2,4-dienoyl-CoA reductase-like NADH-dependent reductase (Old Yellow Enzyme family)
MSDDDIKRLVEDYARAAALAQKIGFDFVDFKQCHGYFGHELLSAVDRPGLYGGSFENRTRFIREGVAAIKAAAPGLAIGMRLSIFDFVPFKKGPDANIGVPEEFEKPYRYAFGGDGTGQGWNMDEPVALVKMLCGQGVSLICGTIGSPYYVPHIQRPALYPPCDGYQPPEEPLKGVARQIKAVAQLKQACPEAQIVASGLTYLQEMFPFVAQRIVADGLCDFAGLGRMMLPYPEIFADSLSGAPLRKRQICRTFSDCTTAPRNGLVSGCYPLDDFYKNKPEHLKLKGVKGK